MLAKVPNRTGRIRIFHFRFSFVFQIVLISLYSVTAMFALSGNLLVIIVLSCSKVRNELAKYLLNLGVADFLFAMFSVPFR